MRANPAPRFQDVRDIRLPVLIERRGHANNDRLNLPYPAEISGSFKASRRSFSGNRLFGDMLDVTSPRIDHFDLFRIDIETENVRAGTGELQ